MALAGELWQDAQKQAIADTGQRDKIDAFATWLDQANRNLSTSANLFSGSELIKSLLIRDQLSSTVFSSTTGWQIKGDGTATFRSVTISGGSLLITNTTDRISLQSDGDAFFGSDLSAAGTTSFSIFSNAQTYNSESMGAGDVLFGDNSSGKANLLWDASDGKILLRGGTTTQGHFDTDGSAVFGGGAVTLNSTGIGIAYGTNRANFIQWGTGDDTPYIYGTANLLQMVIPHCATTGGLYVIARPDSSSYPWTRLCVQAQNLGLGNSNTGVWIERRTEVTNVVRDALSLIHSTQGAPAAGLGVRMSMYVDTDAVADPLILAGAIDAVLTDVTAGSLDGKMNFYALSGGTVDNTDDTVLVLTLDPVESIFNDTGADMNMRFEGDTDTQLLTLDGGTDTVSIGGIAVSGQKLSVYGDMQASGYTGWNFANKTWTYQPTTTNYCLNPSFEVNVTDDWTFGADGGGGSVARTSGGTAPAGTYYAAITAGAINAYIYSVGVSVPNNGTVTLSGWCYNGGTTAAAAYALIHGPLGTSRASSGNIAGAPGPWTRFSCSYTNTTGGALTCFPLLVNDYDGGGTIVYFDAIQLELQTAATPYCDGTLGTGHAWAGTAHNSTSARSYSMFTIAGSDLTTKYQKGTKLKLTDTTVKYFYSVNPWYVADSFGTRVVAYGGTDYALAGTITLPYFSYVENPQGFPDWFAYTPTYTGFSVDPSNHAHRFRISGTHVFVVARDVTTGTSNATTFTSSLPVAAATVTNAYWNTIYGAYVDAGIVGYAGYAEIASGATSVTWYKASGAAWTNLGGKYIAAAMFDYEF